MGKLIKIESTSTGDVYHINPDAITYIKQRKFNDNTGSATIYLVGGENINLEYKSDSDIFLQLLHKFG